MKSNKCVLAAVVGMVAALTLATVSMETYVVLSTGSFNPFVLRVINKFKDFSVDHANDKIEGFDAVSEFVNNCTKNVLTATKLDSGWVFECTLKSSEKSVKESDKSKKDILKNWDAVKKFLEINDSSVTVKDNNDAKEKFYDTAIRDSSNVIAVNQQIDQHFLNTSSGYVESNSGAPLFITSLKVLNQRIRRIDTDDKALTYVQAVIIFRGWINGIYMPIYEGHIAPKGSEPTWEDAIQYLKKHHSSEIDVYGYKLDELVIGLRKLVNIYSQFKVENLFSSSKVENEHMISDFSAPNYTGTLFATHQGIKGWVFVCALKQYKVMYA
ncbi:MAG: hypothetical protein Q4D57_05745 [Clostridia bacterium]|nr:hypothetical protein [Clostridia bacterium]